MKINRIFILSCVFLFFNSCIKDFLPHIEKYNHLLIVSGSITDQPGPYTIKLSTVSTVLQEIFYNPVAGCKIEISDNLGNSAICSEVTPGTYKTDSLGGIQGIVGRKYKLKITAPDGQVYESDEEALKKGVGIESVTSAFKKINDTLCGYQFYVNSESYSLADSTYFYWKPISTYKFQTAYKIDFYYEGNDTIKRFSNPDSLRIGYKTKSIPGIYTFNPYEHNGNRAVNANLYFENNYSDALRFRYCFTVYQYTLDQKQYIYWNTLRKMSANQGSVYTQQPYQLQGNVHNITHPDKPVLGCFMVAGVRYKRAFVDTPPISPDEIHYDYYCTYIPQRFQLPLLYRLNYYMTSADWPIYLCLAIVSPNNVNICLDGAIAGYDVYKSCVDCRVEGVLAKPSFWVD